MLPILGTYYDGEYSRRHHVHVTLKEHLHLLEIRGDTIDAVPRWSLADLRAQSIPGDPDTLILTLRQDISDETQRSLERLSITDTELVGDLRRLCPDLFKTDIKSDALRRICVRVSMAVAAIGMMLFVILPSMANTLAVIIPIEREIAFGKTITAQLEKLLGAENIGDLHCSNADGVRALHTMIERLTEHSDLSYKLEVNVFDIEMVNAFAAPGGQIVIMRGLLETASGPDAVAAVLAHEIGHVERRDATRNSLRAAGSAGLLAMVLGDIGGGTLLAVLADHTLQASYSRKAEEDADVFAIDMLNKAHISSSEMAEFFELLAQSESTVAKHLPGYLWTHPATETRVTRAQDNAALYQASVSVLTHSDWEDLGSICDK